MIFGVLNYLADIFNYLNTVNTGLQGKNENILTCTDKLTAFQKNICLWKNHVIEKNALDMFPSLQNINTDKIILVIKKHLTLLESKIVCYFPSLNIDKYDWIRNPFCTILASELSHNFEQSAFSYDKSVGNISI